MRLWIATFAVTLLTPGCGTDVGRDGGGGDGKNIDVATADVAQPESDDPAESTPVVTAPAGTTTATSAPSSTTPSAAAEAASDEVPTFHVGDIALVPWTADGLLKTKILDMTADGLFLPEFIDLYLEVSKLRPYLPVPSLTATIGTGETVLLRVGELVFVPWAGGMIRTPIVDLTADGRFAVDFIGLYLDVAVIRPYVPLPDPE